MSIITTSSTRLAIITLSVGVLCFVIGSCVASAAPLKTPDPTSDKTINLCTGVEGGVYNEAGNVIKKWGKNLDINVIETEGTIDNIEMTQSNQCNAFIGQPDGLVKVAKESPNIKKDFDV